jgi:molybdate transport system substrate-binding protein
MAGSMNILRTLMIICCAAGLARAEGVTVSAAVSMREALQQVARAYEEQTGERVKLNFGSSGQLMTQVRRGGPVDVFISAAAKQMDELEQAGLIHVPSRVTVAGNDLVLIARVTDPHPPA